MTLAVFFREVDQPGRRPVAYGNADRILVHLEVFGQREVEAAFPRVTESVGPLAWVAILLVPDVLLYPTPALVSEGEDEFEYVGMPFAIVGTLLDVQDEGAIRLQHSFQFLCYWKEPVYVVIESGPLVGTLPVIPIRR